ncbi:MAG: hypothetical protein HY962_02345 [Ignavibacteriae bacterium]|nr:hypothetical protein [Ignavibacteriota bacterium]
MKRTLLLFVLLVFPVLTGVAGAFLEYFQGRSDGNNITLEWKTRGEANVAVFEVQRKAGWQGEFTTVASVDPKGPNSMYTFTDRTAYKSSESVYMYRLRIMEQNGPPSYSNEVTVSHSVSSVKRTWGSIKAMFR